MKKWIFISTMLLFLVNFPLHFLYELFPNFLTSLFTPVNESIFEHMKMIFTSYLLVGLFYSIYKKDDSLNYLFSFLVTSVLCICVYLIVFLPIYYTLGENMIFAIVWLFFSILFSERICFIFVNSPKIKYQKIVTFGILLIFLILSYTCTYYPPKWDFFKDPKSSSYGILNKKA